MNFAAVVAFLVAAVICFALTYVVIRVAVRHALADHYKTTRWFEARGEWVPGPFSAKDAPRGLDEGAVTR